MKRNMCTSPCIPAFLSLTLAVGLATPVLAGPSFTLDTALAAAEKGDAKALYFMARHYARGEGVPQDDARAAQCLRQAAEKGYALAQNDFGAFCATGRGVPQDLAEAARWYQKAAQQGDALAAFSLGRAYWLGCGVATNAWASIAWLKKAAKQRQVEALELLGEIYLNGGPGLERDPRQSFQWFLKAADLGSAEALAHLGSLFEDGDGVARNVGLAVHCYQAAAEKGETQAMLSLSRLCLAGMDEKPDAVEACKWLCLAGRQGDGHANHLKNMLQLQGRVTGPQYEVASRRADDFERAFLNRKPGDSRQPGGLK